MKKILKFLIFTVFFQFLILTYVYAKEVETSCEYYNAADGIYLGMNIYFYNDGTIEGAYYYDGHSISPATTVKKFESEASILEEYQRSKKCPNYVATYQSLNPFDFSAAVQYYLFYNESEKDNLVSKSGAVTTVTWAGLKNSSSPNETDSIPNGYTLLSKTYSKRSNSSKKMTFSIQYNSSNGYYRSGILQYSDVSLKPVMIFLSIDKFQEVILNRAKNGEWPSDLYCGTVSVAMGLKIHQVIYHPESREVKNGDYVCSFDRNLFNGTDYERYTTEGGYLYTPSMTEDNYNPDPDDSNTVDDSNHEDDNIIICDGDNCDISLSGLCNETRVARTLKFLGILITLVKIFVPLLIIVLGSVDFAKAMIEGKGDDIPKKVPVLIKRFITGVIIFLVPSVIDFLFGVIDTYSDTMKQYENCWTCLLDPDECKVND